MRDWFRWALRNDKAGLAFIVVWLVLAVHDAVTGDVVWAVVLAWAVWTALTMSMQECLLEVKQRRIKILEQQVDAADYQLEVFHGLHAQPDVVRGEVVETPDESARIVDFNLRARGSAGLDDR